VCIYRDEVFLRLISTMNESSHVEINYFSAYMALFLLMSKISIENLRGGHHKGWHLVSLPLAGGIYVRLSRWFIGLHGHL
jgi:hypothetical protein